MTEPTGPARRCASAEHLEHILRVHSSTLNKLRIEHSEEAYLELELTQVA